MESLFGPVLDDDEDLIKVYKDYINKKETN